MKKGHSPVLACVGAVVGAGFASGREVVVFFTQYGSHAWWLIILAALIMTGLCMLCMSAAQKQGCCENWDGLMQGRWFAQWCSILLMVLTSGAMISASGHMVALLWAHPCAYAVGALGTLLAAWWIGFCSMKPLNLISAALTLALLCALMTVLVQTPPDSVAFTRGISGSVLAGAVIRAVGYAAMNVMLAVGIICRSAEHTQSMPVASALFGWLIGVLLLIAQCAYARHPETHQMAFPMVQLLSRHGRSGYLFSIVLLYLSVITTLTSVLYSLRTAVETHICRNDLRCLLVLGAPLAVSGLGFSDIVDRLYAPAGLICLAVFFIPLLLREGKRWFASFS